MKLKQETNEQNKQFSIEIYGFCFEASASGALNNSTNNVLSDMRDDQRNLRNSMPVCFDFGVDKADGDLSYASLNDFRVSWKSLVNGVINLLISFEEFIVSKSSQHFRIIRRLCVINVV